MKQILDKSPTGLFYLERNVFRKDVKTKNIWSFEEGDSGNSTPTHIIRSFEARNKIDSHLHDNSSPN